MNTIDFERINNVALSQLESLCVMWFPYGKRDGREYKIGDLNGNAGSSLSINLNTGVWCDFASGDKGSDPISLYSAMKGITQGESARELDNILSANGVTLVATVGRDRKKSKSDEWQPLPHAPEKFPEPDFKHYKYGMPSTKWIYLDAQNRHVGFICRFDTKEGKEVLPITWCENETGSKGWRWKAFAKPRSLYKAELIASDSHKPVLIVEGEKTADSAQRLLPHIIVCTWAGGAKAVDISDWSQLADRKVIIWGDNDEAGVRASLAIQGFLPHAKIVQPPHAVEGWDLADAEAEGWTTEQVRSYLKQAKQSAPEVRLPLPPVAEEIDTTDYSEVPALPEPPQAVTHTDEFPFRILGYDDGSYFYLPNASKQIVSLGAGEHKHLQLLRLAPASFWEVTFPASKGGTDWNAVANALIERSHRMGIFSPKKIRGRGVWIDGEHVVFHAGDSLIVNGKSFGISEFDSKYIYEQGQHLDSTSEPALDNVASAKLIAVCEKLSWRDPIFAKFLAGWCAIAPISGVLHWRPHIWINGASGTGKTWTLNNILEPLVGKVALKVQSATTEAGIRQSLRSDSLPIIFDEAESEDQKGRTRMQSILELARQASSEGGAGIIKGSATGKAQEYQIRSCFAFASIGVSATMRADTSRITSLELKKLQGDEAEKQFTELKKLWSESMAGETYADGMRSRSLQLAKVICANAKTFSSAVASKLGDQRVGDQIGTLLAGAYSLTSTKIVDLEFAKQWCESQNWNGFTVQETDTDEVRAIAILLDAHIRTETEKGIKTFTVSELISTACGGDADQYVEGEDAINARKVLLRYGIKVDEDTISISNHHQELKKIFRETPWADKWSNQFSRMEGAVNLPTCRFGGSTHRAVKLPIGMVR